MTRTAHHRTEATRQEAEETFYYRPLPPFTGHLTCDDPWAADLRNNPGPTPAPFDLHARTTR